MEQHQQDRVIGAGTYLTAYSFIHKERLEFNLYLTPVIKRYHLTLEALTEVDQGSFIDHSVVQAWADSLDTETPLPTPHV